MSELGLCEKIYYSEEIIVKEGTPSTNVYVILEGCAQVFKMVAGKKVGICTLKIGDVFGEMGIIGQTKSSASVRALEHVRVAVVPEGNLRRLIAGLPLEIQYILETLIERLRNTTAQLAEATAHDEREAVGETSSQVP